ncbi:MAG: hypothetical protein N2578_09110, partial [Bdellovibrionaceae bacterium]|nr:hypothetical protein [Pseudobdellovibrionaceae bacterium]
QVRPRDNRQNLLSLVDANSIESPIYAGVIFLNHDTFGDRLRPIKGSPLEQYLLGGSPRTTENPIQFMQNQIEKGVALRKRQLEQSSYIPLPEFAAKAGLVLIQPNSPERVLLNKALGQNLNQPFRARPSIYESIFQSYLRHLERQSESFESLHLINGGLSTQQAALLCQYWFYRLAQNDIQAHMAMYAARECALLATKDPRSVFTTERRLIVHRLTGSEHLEGRTHNISTGAAFSLTRAKSYTFNTSLNAGAKIEISPEKLFGFLGVGVGGSYNLSWTQSDSDTRYSSVSVSEDRSLRVRENRVRLSFDRYEQCTIIRFNPALLTNQKERWYQFGAPFNFSQVLKDPKDPHLVASFATRGLMICDGKIHQRSMSHVEHYYLIQQEIESNEQQDAGDIRNRPFFLALRGKSDYDRRLILLKKQNSKPNTSTPEERTWSVVNDNLTRSLFVDPIAPGHLLL